MGVKAKKEYGQNFLIDEVFIEKLVEVGKVCESDTVLEIGAGVGYLTRKIAERAGRLIAIEIDKDLISALSRNTEQFRNITVLNGDGLSFLKSVEVEKQKINKVVSSLPFQVTSPVLHSLVLQKDQIKLSSLLVQNEVADRITASPPKANYMSVFLSAFFNIQKVCGVSRFSFDPVPKVDGAIVKISASDRDPIRAGLEQRFSRFLHHGFGQQRKMLNKRFDKDLLEKAGIGGGRRAESLSLAEWLRFFEIKGSGNIPGSSAS